MKKTIQILIGIIAFVFLIVIIKKNFLTDDNAQFYDKAWSAYENKQYETAITYFNLIDKDKYPEILMPLGSSYLKIGNYKNAIQNLSEAYKKEIGKKTDNYNKVLNTLGVCYLEVKDFKQARFYLEKALKEGNPKSLRNIQILDSLEQIQKNAPDINQ